MPNDGQTNYPGEQHHYDQNPPITNYPDSQIAPTVPFGAVPQGEKASSTGGKKPRNIWRTATLILFITTVIFAGTTYLLFTHPITNGTTTTVIATATPGPQQATTAPTSPAATSAPTTSTTPVSTTGSTPIAQSALTPVPDGLIQKNITLTCSGCNDPIRITLDTIRIDSANGRTVWDNTVKDVTGANLNYNISTYTLQDSTTQTPAVAAVFAQNGGNLVSNIPADTQGIFAFIPSRNITYVLSVVIFVGGIGYTTFDPLKITF